MAEKIVIAELELNTKKIQEDNQKLLKGIANLREANKTLRKETNNLTTATNEQARAYVDNDAKLKKLSAEYNSNKKLLAENLTGVQGLNDALAKESKNVNEAEKNNKKLRVIRNQINSETDAGKRAIEQINEKLNENTEFIKANVSQLENQKINIGNYKDDIIEAYKELEKNKQEMEANKNTLIALRDATEKGSDEWNFYNTEIKNTNTQINVLITDMGGLNDEMNASSSITKLLSGDFKGLSEDAKSVGGAGNLMKSSLKGATSGMISLTKSTLAFIATPIGALLALIVGAFLLVKNAMNRSEDATNKISKAFSAFQGITNKLLKILEPLGEFLIDGIVKGFELAEKAIYKTIDVIASGLKALGFDEQAKSLRNFNIEIQEGAKDAKALADAEAKLAKEQRKSQKIQLDYQKDAEKLRQIRDDESLSIAERIKANDELGAVLKEQLKEELRIAELALEVANLRIQAEGETSEALDQQAEALTTIADIQERITGQESEQLTNRVALQKEAADKAKERADKAIAEQEAQLQLFIEQQGRRAKSVEEQLSIFQKVYEKEVEILKANLKNRNITQTEYDAQLLALKNDLLQEQTDLAISEAERELQIFKDTHQSKLDANTFFTEALLEQETARLDAIAEKEREYQQKRLEEGVINQQQYNDAINAINEENRIAQEELKQEREEAEAEKKIVDLENQRAIDEENFLNQFEIESARLELQRKKELETAKKTGADKEKIEQKFDLRQQKLQQKQQVAEIQMAQNTFNQIGGLLKGFFGENKELNIALATADMVLGIQKAYVSQLIPGDPTSVPRAVGAGIKAGVFGAANVAKVAGVKFEKGGLQEIGGKRHSQGGTKFLGEDGTAFEAEQGELIGVMNRNAAALFMEFNDKYRRGGVVNRPNVFENGGFVQRQTVLGQKMEATIDYDVLAEKMSEANRNLPRPVVSVVDITDGQDSYADVVDGANI